MKTIKIAMITGVLLGLLWSTNALAQEASSWQQFMSKAATAQRALEFDQALQYFKQALDATTKTETAQQVLTLTSMGQLSQQQGDYASAEHYYRAALSLPEKEYAKPFLSDVLDELGRHDEAKQLRSDSKYVTAQQTALLNDMMVRVQARLKQPWSQHLHQKRKDAFRKWKPGHFDGFPTGDLGWDVVHFLLIRGRERPVGFLYETSGNSVTAAASVTALNSAQTEDLIPQSVDIPLLVEFTFDVNAGSPAISQLRERRLHDLRARLEWQQTKLGINHPETAKTLVKAADMLSDEKRITEAERAYAKAMEIWKSTNVESSNKSYIYRKYGEALPRQGKASEALPYLREAYDTASLYVQPNTDDMVKYRDALAKALTKTGHANEAKALYPAK